jgi:F-type H+-transporting ATPase subunit epsilon
MSDKTFKLEIVTPVKLVFSGDVTSFTAPGTAGGFQVLHNHAPLLAEIGIGEVKLTDTEGNERHFATSGGFVDVKKNHVVMLAETAERSDEIDRERALAARERAARRLAENDEDLDDARSALARAINRLRVVQRADHQPA